MTKERKRPAIMESHPVTCLQCGHVTKISYQRRRDDPLEALEPLYQSKIEDAEKKEAE